jgi:photosystem II stability/assembly factor-like uncharacterized protein
MKKLFSLLTLLNIAVFVFAAHVPQQEAQKVAIRFYKQYGMGNSGSPVVLDATSANHQSVTTFYTFRFVQGGFVLVAADDASIPILGYAFDREMPQVITNPATKDWLDGYSREIYNIIQSGLDNTETLKQWNAIRSGTFPSPSRDVQPLLNTTWDQGCFYNTLCPADPAAGWSCGHVYTGCVATAMAQIMKYHDFPPQGIGSHTYTHPQYGVQTANFGATTYDWSSMPNNVTGNNTPVATLMYHAGVSVDMQYGVSGSGAFSDDVPYALLNYFNYHPDVEIRYKNNYPNVDDFKALLRADLDEQLPVYYSGYGSGGHAFVCDGYRTSDDKFHFNWGWSGSSNGWYAIGALNPGGNNFNDDNAAVLHIKPYNPNLVVRITHPVDNAVIGVGYTVEIEAVTVLGTPAVMKLFIDGVEKFSTANDTLSFSWSTSPGDLGSHDVKAFAYTATDTVYFPINLNVAEWITQSSGFAVPSRGINYMSAVDSNTVWASGFDNTNPTASCSDFTRTTDGGTTWTAGTIPNTTGLASAMIFGIDANKAYTAMYKVSGSKPQGIYTTDDGGATWSRQTTASFGNSASFPNCVHFFNENEGWCMGDPISGEYEIYTTVNGGTTWTQVAGSAIPNPSSGEFGIVGYYSAVNDTIWFGTNKGRVYRSPDKGHTWTVATVTALSGKYIKPTFRNGSHGLVQDKDAGTTGAICESFDGGDTWTPVTTTGTIYATDLAYVPGTENTWVSSGSTGTNGCSYSFDGGHTWTDFQGTQGAAYMQMTWLNNHCGWAGGVNVSATENGAYRFIGLLNPPLPPPINLQAIVSGHNVNLSWEPPVSDNPTFNLMGYNMYRNGTKLNSAVITGVTYPDQNVPSGQYEYCVTAVYNIGESTMECTLVDVAVGTGEIAAAGLRVYPNPAKDLLNISSAEPILAVSISNFAGQQVYAATGVSSTVDLSTMKPGVYAVRVTTASGISVTKIIIQ